MNGWMGGGGVRFREGSERNTTVSQETLTYGWKMSPPFCVKPKELKINKQISGVRANSGSNNKLHDKKGP